MAALDLGREGEESTRHLLDGYALRDHFSVSFVLSPHDDALDEVRSRLAARAPRVLRVEIDADVPDALKAAVEQLERTGMAAGGEPSDAMRPVIWLQQQTPDEAAWKPFLAFLNTQREWLRDHLRGLLVIAAPLSLADWAASHAPDIWSISGRVHFLREAPRPMYGSEPIRWLHLSDFHFRDGERWDRRVLLTKLLDHVDALRNQGLAPQLVLVTGDIANTGAPAEYDMALRFFDKLAERTQLDPRQRFFIVPGNHDVDRQAIGPVDASILQGVAAAADPQRELDRIQQHAATMQLLGARFEAFYHFSTRLLGPARGWHAQRPWRADMVELDGLQLGLLMLSSAWASGSDADRGQLMIGEGVVRDGLRDIEPAHLKLAMMHHPLGWLHEWDEQRLQALLGSREGVDFLLRGHLHQSHTLALSAPGGNLIECAAGASYTHDSWSESIALTEVDRAQGEARVHLFKYSRRGAGFWAPETDAYEQAQDGVVRWALPPHLHAVHVREAEDAEQAEASATQQAARRESQLERYRRSYRQVAVAVHGQVRFSGVAYDSRKPNARVEELFVPLRLTLRGGLWLSDREREVVGANVEALLGEVEAAEKALRLSEGDTGAAIAWDDEAASFAKFADGPAVVTGAEDAADHSVSTDDLARWLTKVATGHGEEAAHAVVLGAPGSGKSTLCLYLAVLLAGGMPPQRGAGLTAADLRDCVPYLVPYREMMALNRERHGRGEAALDLLGFLQHQVNVRLSLPAGEELIEQTLQRGHAVLLVDGLDEVGSAELRGRACDDLVAFCLRFPKTAVLCTSRGAGYDEAPLPKKGPRSFTCFELQPFNEDDRRTFVARWYALQEPDDVVARDRGSAQLIAALDAAPYVKALARNPLLATLIALVHHSRARLPGGRAELYEACVNTLLETWPARRGRRFTAIVEDQQRDYLEQLAMHMQQARDEGQGQLAQIDAGLKPEPERNVLIDRDALIDALAAIMRERDRALEPEETTRRLARQWVKHLEEGTGLLTEQRTGAFGFLHLSFLEYLVACRLERLHGRGEALAEQVLALYGAPQWKQACLLAVGRNASQTAFVDALFQHINNACADRPDGWLVLLRCMREEAAFTGEQQNAILAGVGQLLLERGTPGRYGRYPWATYAEQVAELEQFSERHRAGVTQWLEDQWRHGEGDALRGAVVLAGRAHERTLERLASREDAATAAGSLLSWGEEHPFGHWAYLYVSATAALHWATTKAPFDTLALKAVSATAAANAPLSAALSVSLASRCAWASKIEQDGVERLKEIPRDGGYGLPHSVTVYPGESVLPATLLGSMTVRSSTSHKPRLAGPFGRSFAMSLALLLAKSFDGSFVLSLSDVSDQLFTYSERPFVDFFKSSLVDDFADIFARTILAAVVTASSTSLSLGDSFSDFSASTFALSIVDLNVSEAQPPIPTDPKRGHDNAWPSLDGEKDIEKNSGIALAAVTADAWVGIVTTHDLPFEHRHAYTNFRTTNRWLLYIWSVLDKRTPHDSPHHLALYLALGWTQACSTWQWPATERWIALLSGPPPEHWLPRLHWHQCWRLYDPDSVEHREGVRRAIEEGRGDAELPGYADAFAEVLRTTDDSSDDA